MAFDRNPEKSGVFIHGVPVLPMDAMESKIHDSGVKTAILTVASASAQKMADVLVRAGIEGIWNFAHVKLKVPENVVVQNEDLSSGYALLSVMMQSLENQRNS